MLTIALNPGFVLMLAVVATLAAPRSLRAPIIAIAALTSLWLLLDYDFGAASAVAQMGLPVVLLDLDALNRIFGIGLLLVLIALALFANARNHRLEDAALLLMTGATVTALFVGDLVSFVAAAALGGLATAWVVFCSPLPGAQRAGARLLVWNGLEGLLLLVGVAFHLASGQAGSMFVRLDLGAPGGAFIFAALLIRVGAPLMHVWVKDAIAHASPLGGAAISVHATILGVYALARFFPAEPTLLWVGAGMIVLGAVFAIASDDFRAAAAYGQMTQTGICVALIGVGSPLAMAAAEGHVFTSTLAFAALHMAFGAVLLRRGEVRASRFDGVAQAMPLTCALMLIAGLALSAMPGFALYTTLMIGLDATAGWDLRWLWTLFAASSAALFISLALRPMLAAHRHADVSFREAPFSMLLAGVVASFFSFAIGLAPGWLYGLLPTAVAFAPYTLDRTAPQLELLGVAGAAFILLRALRAAPPERTLDLLDADAFYRGPVAATGAWAGVVLLRIYGAVRAWAGAGAQAGARLLGGWMRTWDRPYRVRRWEPVQLVIALAFLGLTLLGASF